MPAGVQPRMIEAREHHTTSHQHSGSKRPLRSKRISAPSNQVAALSHGRRLLERVQRASRNSSRPRRVIPLEGWGRATAGRPAAGSAAGALAIGPDPGGAPLRGGRRCGPVKPRQCYRCEHPFPGEDPQPRRHQVTALPPVKPVVTVVSCTVALPGLGRADPCGSLVGVPADRFGPRVQAMWRCPGRITCRSVRPKR